MRIFLVIFFILIISPIASRCFGEGTEIVISDKGGDLATVTNNRLDTYANVNPGSKIISGQTTIITAGTAVVLGATQSILSLTMTPMLSNVGGTVIYVGTDGVTSSSGYEVATGATVTLDISSPGIVYVNSNVSDAKVSWVALTQ